MQIGRRLLDVISAVLSAAEKKRADVALREALRTAQLSPAEKSQVTHLVFSFYRWRGWLDLKKPLRSQLEVVNELVESFAAKPESFDEKELVTRALPDWSREIMPISAALVREFQHEPRLWLRARPGKGAQLNATLNNCVVHETVSDALWFRGREDLYRTSLFHEGEFEMQDLSSQAVGHICSPEPGQTWWDVCAGEGGKTLHLCDLMQNKGTVWASDPAEWRLANLKRRASRAKLFNYRVAPWAHKDHLPTKTKFDGILVDAPCSGTGTWGRNPQARWTTTVEDVHELAELQLSILKKIAGSVKPGGNLIYAVCTLARPETVEVAEAFTRAHPDFEPLEIANPANPLQRGTTLELLPHEMGANGMFVAAWRR
ncbi:MAG TPA: RsmB/NOP family class I SAM-dependent RNA methyltransferase [Verrucomicrobiae bacterium]